MGAVYSVPAFGLLCRSRTSLNKVRIEVRRNAGARDKFVATSVIYGLNYPVNYGLRSYGLCGAPLPPPLEFGGTGAEKTPWVQKKMGVLEKIIMEGAK